MSVLPVRRFLKLTNETRYDTRDLRRIVLAGMAAHGLTACRVQVVRRRKGGCGGRATYGERGRLVLAARWMKLCLDEPGGLMSTALRVAMTVDHEIYHLRGLKHRQFPGHVERYIGEPGKTCHWFVPETMVLRFREEAPAPVVTLADRREKRAEHAETMHKKALTRLKRAQTLATKWRKRCNAIAAEGRRAALKEGTS